MYLQWQHWSQCCRQLQFVSTSCSYQTFHIWYLWFYHCAAYLYNPFIMHGIKLCSSCIMLASLWRWSCTIYVNIWVAYNGTVYLAHNLPSGIFVWNGKCWFSMCTQISRSLIIPTMRLLLWMQMRTAEHLEKTHLELLVSMLPYWLYWVNRGFFQNRNAILNMR